MLVHVDKFKIYIIEQENRSRVNWNELQWDIVQSVAYPEIDRNSQGTICNIYIQGCLKEKDHYPLITKDSDECFYVLQKLNGFCKFYNESFKIIGRMRLC